MEGPVVRIRCSRCETIVHELRTVHHLPDASETTDRRVLVQLVGGMEIDSTGFHVVETVKNLALACFHRRLHNPAFAQHG